VFLTLVQVAARAALFAFFPALLAGQEPARGVIMGQVTVAGDSAVGGALGGARISVVGTALGATSATDGRYRIVGVPAGRATLRVRLLRYRSVDLPVVVANGDTTRADVALRPEPQLLSTVETRARAEDAELFSARPNIGVTTLGAETMNAIPTVGEPDVARTVQLLPGVISRNDYNTGLIVHGGEADQNLVLLDGYPVHNPFHLGGLFGTFIDATVGRIELMSSAPPAQFGGRLSSVLDVRSADDARRGVHLTADVSALAATGVLSGGFGGDRGTWSFGARRTYADALQSIFTDNIFPYHFHDFQGRVTYALPGRVRLAATAYTGNDVLDANLAEFAADSLPTKAGNGTWGLDWGNRVVGLSAVKTLGAVRLFGRRIADSAAIEQRVSTSGFRTHLDLGDGAQSQRSEIRDLRFGGSLVLRGESHDAGVGYEVATHRMSYSSGSPQTATVDFDLVQKPVTSAVYVTDLWRIGSRLLVDGGLRGEALSTRQWAALSPRVSVKYFATPTLALTAGAGRVTQWMQSLAGDGPLRYFDVWIASDSFIPVATAWQYVAGVERRHDAGSVRIEAYLKNYDRVLQANWSEDPSRRGDEFFLATGRSYGADLYARWQPATGPSGWLTYSYGLSSRTRDGITWAPGHDRRHDVDAFATWRMAKYRLGAHFGFATGTPYTPIVGQIVRRVYDPARDSWGTGDPRLLLESLGAAHNSARFPPTHRLDLDVSRELLYRGATLTPYLSLVNVYNAQNVFVYRYDYSTDRPTRRAISQFPVLPSAGVRIAF
jgi:Carboxypeptidase regulatory-like domain